MSKPPQRARSLAPAVHSVDLFVFSVPDLEEARRFFTAFGHEVRRIDRSLELYTAGHAHCWARIHENGERKRFEYLTLGIHAGDEDAFARRISAAGIGCDPHPLGDSSGLWLRTPDATPWQLRVAPKCSPDRKGDATVPAPVAPGAGAAPARSRVPQVRPRYLSHVMFFSPDVLRMVRFCEDVLGLRLSDRTQDLVAFMHSAHGSDHHLVAFAKSDGPGMHHSSWDVGSIDEVGMGAEQMRKAGYDAGWGVGRHVLGSNFFHYVRDPWGSFAEYSFDIDHIGPHVDWVAKDHPGEDSFYVWGPPQPAEMLINTETATY